MENSLQLGLSNRQRMRWQNPTKNERICQGPLERKAPSEPNMNFQKIPSPIFNHQVLGHISPKNKMI